MKEVRSTKIKETALEPVVQLKGSNDDQVVVVVEGSLGAPVLALGEETANEPVADREGCIHQNARITLTSNAPEVTTSSAASDGEPPLAETNAPEVTSAHAYALDATPSFECRGAADQNTMVANLTLNEGIASFHQSLPRTRNIRQEVTRIRKWEAELIAGRARMAEQDSSYHIDLGAVLSGLHQRIHVVHQDLIEDAKIVESQCPESL